MDLSRRYPNPANRDTGRFCDFNYSSAEKRDEITTNLKEKGNTRTNLMDLKLNNPLYCCQLKVFSSQWSADTMNLGHLLFSVTAGQHFPSLNGKRFEKDSNFRLTNDRDL